MRHVALAQIFNSNLHAVENANRGLRGVFGLEKVELFSHG